MSLAVHNNSTATHAAASSTSTGSSSSSSSSATDLTSTFMDLLMAELKNQDPMSPMDTAEMVNQMVNLNELNTQLGIESLLTNSLGTSTSSTSSATHNTPAAAQNSTSTGTGTSAAAHSTNGAN